MTTSPISCPARRREGMPLPFWGRKADAVTPDCPGLRRHEDTWCPGLLPGGVRGENIDGEDEGVGALDASLGGTRAAVAVSRRDDEHHAAANLAAEQAVIPALDDLAFMTGTLLSPTLWGYRRRGCR